MNKTTQTTLVQVVSYYPPHVGGMEGVAYEIAHELARRGNPVRVLTSNIGIDKSLDVDREENYEARYLNSFEFAHTPIAPSLLWELLTLPKRSIIHLHMAQAYYPESVLLASKIRSIPYVAHFHLDVGPSGFFGALFLIYKKLVWVPVLRSAKKVIVFSEEQKELVIKKFGVKELNVAIIPNGVGKDFFVSAPRDTFHTPIKLLYVGRFSVQKRVERLLSAIALLTVPVELTLVGDGEDRESLHALATKLALTNVIFAGKKYGAELKEYYRNADALVIPSDIEGMPLVVLEAMAAALPIIGSDVPGIRELVKDMGVLVPNPSPETFAAAITTLVEDPEELKRLSKQSFDKAQNFSWEKLVGTLEAIYKEIRV